MLKETVICLVILIGVIMLDGLAQNYTKEVVVNIEEKLRDLRIGIEESLGENKQNDLEEQMDRIYKEWNAYYSNLSYYIDHGDIGKIDINLIATKSLIDAGQYDVAMSEIDKCIYELKYMHERSKLTMSNLF